MTPERWQHVSRVLEAVLERPPDERESFLQQTRLELESIDL